MSLSTPLSPSTSSSTSPSGLSPSALTPGPESLAQQNVGVNAGGSGGSGLEVKGKKKVEPWKHFLAGGVGGMTGAIVTSPFDVVKTRLQSDLFRPTASTSSPASASSSAVASSSRLSSNPSSSSLPKPYNPPSSSTSHGGPSTALNYKNVRTAAVQTAVQAGERPTGVRGLAYHFIETGEIIRRIYVDEGPRALFKGLGPTLVGVVPARAINFSTYATTKSFLANNVPALSSSATATTNISTRAGAGPGVGAGAGVAAAESSPLVHLCAAAVAGIVTSTATNPIWVVKTRLQLEQKSSPLSPLLTSPSTTTTSPTSPLQKFLPALKLTRQILAHEGIRGLYKGMSASYLGVTEGVIQWVLYERLKKISLAGSGGDGEGGVGARGTVGQFAGIVGSSGGAKMVASLITYPHEVIRTRLRQAPPPGRPPKYTGLLQTLKLVIAEEGAASLYGGLSAHLMRVVPNAACMFTIYEIALRL